MSFFGSLFGTDSAAKAIKNAQNKNIQQSQQTQQQNNALYQPFVGAGTAAVNKQSDLLGLNGVPTQTQAYKDFQFSPDYQVRFDQGQSALERSALGKYGSGAAANGNVLKALDKYGADQGTQGFSDYWNRLMGVGGQGLTAAGGNASSNLGINTAITGANTAIGNAEANKDLQNGGILGGILSLGTQIFAPGVNRLFNPVATTGPSYRFG